ncbi:hypothetical protein [Streptomyces sp. OE57]|uniref:hypothetical protein n=1 Tax=Streptomyces lacaronensis TaxID=3379885 RepID=UPI0039B78BAF
MDPLRLELDRTRHADAARYVETVIRAAGWIDALGLDRPPHAVVSTTAPHCLAEDSLRGTYHQLADPLHEGHDHQHREGCGHVAVPHGDHVDYVHDGHRHAQHQDHWDDH